MTPRYADRAAAGRELARAVQEQAGEVDLVLALPRGGVPVAAPVAAALGAPLDVLVVRKLGAPGRPELAVGAIAAGGVRVLNVALLRRLSVAPDQVEDAVARETQELLRRERAYRGDRPPVDLRGRRVVVVDDGLATGATALAAVQVVAAGGAERTVLAVPVGAPDAVARLSAVADAVVCPHAPARFAAVGEHYADFRQTTDEEVRRALDR